MTQATEPTETPNTEESTALQLWTVPDDMREEFSLIPDERLQIPFYFFRGDWGLYVPTPEDGKEPEKKDPANKETLDVIILNVYYSQTLKQQKGDGYSNPILCRAKRLPGNPELNQDLTPEELTELAGRGIGIACKTCPMNKWNPRPQCTSYIRLVCIDNENNPVVISIRGVSVTAIQDTLRNLFTQPPDGQPRPWYAATVQFYSSDAKNARGTFNKAGLRVIASNPPSMGPDLEKLRRQYIDLLENHQHDEADHEETEQAQPSSPPVQQSTAAAAPPKKKLQVDENGELIYSDPEGV